MKILPFIQSLLPSFEKNRVLEDIRLTRTEIEEISKPAFDEAVPLFKNWVFKSEALVQMSDQFHRLVKKGHNDNIVLTIEKAFKPALANLETAEDLITQTYASDVAGDGMTYMKANLLQFVSAVNWMSKYSRKLLNYIYICETSVYPDGDTVIDENVTKAELAFLRDNFVTFCTVLNIVSTNPTSLKKLLAEVPDIMVTADNATTLTGTVGSSKLDPLHMGLVPIALNPIYHIGMLIAEWQASRYKSAKEELRLIELRKLNLMKLHDGKPDAAVQHQIEYSNIRAQGLNYKIAQMEAAHG
jgi:hypothetical protein